MFLNMIISFKGKVGISKEKHILKYDNSAKDWAWKERAPGTCCFRERTGAWDLLFHGKGWSLELVVSWKEQDCRTCCFMEMAGTQDMLFHGKGWCAGLYGKDGRLGLVL
jgi:hypothetical protein